MAGAVKVEVALKHWFKALERTTEENAIYVLIMAAKKIVAIAETIAPVETGALSRSIAIVSKKEDTWSRAVILARKLRPDVSIQRKPVARKNEVWIVPVVGYAGHQEFGTIYHGAQAFLFPTVNLIAQKVLPEGFGAEIFGKYKRKPPIIMRWSL